MLLGIDCANAPSLSQLDKWQALTPKSLSFMAVYLQGPASAASGYTREKVDEYRSLGFQLLPVWEGRQNGDQLTKEIAIADVAYANWKLQNLGIEDGCCILDIEANTFSQWPTETTDYWKAFVEEWRESYGYRYKLGVYGTLATITACASVREMDCAWLASWLTRTTVNAFNEPDSLLLARPLKRVRQYWNGVLEGEAIDLNISDEDFPFSSPYSNNQEMSSAVPFEAVPEATAEPVIYTVVPGDSLSEIAYRQGHPGDWELLYDRNRELIGDSPNVIYPGMELVLPW